jgi:hypothetical protein
MLSARVPPDGPAPLSRDERMTASASGRGGRPAAAAPRISDQALAARPGSAGGPAPHTAREISALVIMLRAARVSTIAIGHGRHATSRDAAAALTGAWNRAGGTVLDTVDWPARAASWLKPARQLVRACPDAWVIADNPAGCAQLARRLAEHEPWSAARTFGTASAGHPDTAALAGSGLLDGLRGVTADGAGWQIANGVLSRARLTPWQLPL